MTNWFQRNSVHFLIIGIFLVLSFAYMQPVLMGKVSQQGDVMMAKAMQKEIMDYKAAHGHGPLWTNNMFSGMPAYQIWVQYPMNIASYITTSIITVFPNPVGLVWLYLVGAYILFASLRLKPWLAAAASVAFAFTSYNFIIIEAGHLNKSIAIAYFAPILAVYLMAFRKKYMASAVLMAFFISLEIRANHLQMTYYLMLALLVFTIFQLVDAIKNKTLPHFSKAIGVLILGASVGLLVNMSMLWSNAEYTKESNRGPSNLTAKMEKVQTGVSRDYAYTWSQGVGESLTFLVPNFYGGGSQSFVGKNSNTEKALIEIGAQPEQAQGVAAQLATYSGDKPGTSGPYYFGALVMFLFVLGMFTVKNRMKWAIFTVSVLFLFLSFGKSLPFISDLFFDYFPLYNKFRAVESILAVVGLMVPFLGFWAVKEITEEGVKPQELKKHLQYSVYIVGGLCLLMAAVPTVFHDFKGVAFESITQWAQQMFQGNASVINKFTSAIIEDRVSIARMDALRSLVFVGLGFGLLWFWMQQKIKTPVLYFALFALVLVDMWQVDKRFFNNDNFVSKAQNEAFFQPNEIDQLIMADKDPYFRVMNVPQFESAVPSYFYKTIGGYHAAKLKRYQELIENQFSTTINHDVLDMLNAKYLVGQDPKTGAARLERNHTACGNAWLVSKITYVNGADAEMKALNSFSPKDEVFVDVSYKSLLGDADMGQVDTVNSSIRLTSYSPDALTYDYSSKNPSMAVFSDIYYSKGWNMYIDGIEKPYIRANYLLRAAALPEGNHKIEFKFEPKSYYLGEKISLFGSILLVLGLAYLIFSNYKMQKTKN